MRCFLCRLHLNLSYHGICSNCIDLLPRLGKVCAKCGLPHSLTSEICYRCLENSSSWDRLISVTDYVEPLKKMIHHLKFYQKIELSYALSRLMFLAWYRLYLQGELSKPDCITCVPLHHHRYWLRGYNQAELLAKPIAHWLNRPFYPYLLYRKQRKQDQKSLSRIGRAKNVVTLFGCDSDLTGRSILVVDDIVTTGSTCNAISERLKDQGAREVQILTLCRTFL
ncbi:phosphoribosyltransferase family protein [Orbaceae bacterium ESL0721]|nr:phosphoribosyltransferase family protein [Orbaceae bacterium ESL0721]